jgi:hypothetical protein
MVTMSGSNAALLSDERSHFLKLFTVDVTVSVQVEHAERNFEVPT